MKLFHVTTKKKAKQIEKDGKFNTPSVFAWGQFDMAVDWASLHGDEPMAVVVIETPKANWSGLYYWFFEEKSEYFIIGILNL